MLTYLSTLVMNRPWSKTSCSENQLVDRLTNFAILDLRSSLNKELVFLASVLYNKLKTRRKIMENKKVEALKIIKATIADCPIKEARDWILSQCLMTIDWLERELREED